MTKDNTELKPCPFCGASDDDLGVFCDPDEGRDNSGPSRRIQCFGCNIEAPFYDTKAEAITAWNTRHTATDGLAGELERLIEHRNTGNSAKYNKLIAAWTGRNAPAILTALQGRTYADGVEDAAKVVLSDWDVLRQFIPAAAVAWCGTKDRETFPEDVAYFENNWRLPGLLKFVIAQAIRALKDKSND